MNKELRAAQDQLDRAAKRGWSRAGGMLPYTLNQDRSLRIHYLWNFTNVHISECRLRLKSRQKILSI